MSPCQRRRAALRLALTGLLALLLLLALGGGQPAEAIGVSIKKNPEGPVPDWQTPKNCRQLLVHFFGGLIQCIKLDEPPSKIKHLTWNETNAGGHVFHIFYHNNKKQTVKLMWGTRAIYGVSLWCRDLAAKCPRVPRHGDQEYVLNLQKHFKGRTTMLSCPTFVQNGLPGKVIFNNFNAQKAQNQPSQNTRFKLEGTYRISEIITWHHNSFRGKAPGEIFIKGVQGTGGQWSLKAKAGIAALKYGPYYYLPNSAWIAKPDGLVLGPGNYEIDVSDRQSWSHNTGSGGAGFAVVWGEKTKDQPPITGGGTGTGGGGIGDEDPKDDKWKQCPGWQEKQGAHFILTWTHTGDSKENGPDIDLKVVDPDGDKLKSSIDDEGGYTDKNHSGDIGWGSGPECVTVPLNEVKAGTYEAWAELSEGDGFAKCKLEVYVNGIKKGDSEAGVSPDNKKSHPLKIELKEFVKKGQRSDPTQTIRYKNGVYKGQAKNNMPHGRGAYTYNNGNKYVGQYVEGKRHGKGRFTWKSGNEYAGEFSNGYRTGHGVLTWAKSGNKYVGRFDKGRPSGGKFYWADGRVAERSYQDKKGQWVNKEVSKPKTSQDPPSAFARGDVSFVLTWKHRGDSRPNGPDIDIRVTDPKGNILSSSARRYMGPTKEGGQVDQDDEGGYAEKGDQGSGGGPERVFWPKGKAPAGTYQFSAEMADGDGTALFSIEVFYKGKKIASVGNQLDPKRKKSRIYRVKIP